MKIGIALSGGGARGIGHLGIIKVLQENGIEFSVISGTSAGALVGSLLASGYEPEEILDIVVKTKIFPSFRPSLSFKGLLKTSYLGDLLNQHLKVKEFEELKIPLIVSATDINLGKSVYFSSGHMIEPIKASCCVPLFFEPVTIDGNTYVDGGILDNLPSEVIKDKCDFLLGCHSNSIRSDFNTRNFKDVIERSLLMAINGNTIKSKELCDFIIEPPEMGNFSGFDLSKAKELYDVGYDYTESILDQLLEKLQTFSKQLS